MKTCWLLNAEKIGFEEVVLQPKCRTNTLFKPSSHSAVILEIFLSGGWRSLVYSRVKQNASCSSVALAFLQIWNGWYKCQWKLWVWLGEPQDRKNLLANPRELFYFLYFLILQSLMFFSKASFHVVRPLPGLFDATRYAFFWFMHFYCYFSHFNFSTVTYAFRYLLPLCLMKTSSFLGLLLFCLLLLLFVF